jgi:hypothetical protein
MILLLFTVLYTLYFSWRFVLNSLLLTWGWLLKQPKHVVLIYIDIWQVVFYDCFLQNKYVHCLPPCIHCFRSAIHRTCPVGTHQLSVPNLQIQHASPLSGPYRSTCSWNALNLCSSIQWDSIFRTSVEQYDITGSCVALQCSWISRSTQNKPSMLHVQRFFYPCQIEEEWTCVFICMSVTSSCCNR